MKTRMLPVAILAGGLATRLRPVTETIPKALVDIDGEPFVAHQLRLLRNTGGIELVVICAGYLGEMIREFVGDGSRLGLEVLFSFDGDRLLGTGGAIRKALPLLGDAFFVLYGDSYLPCDYRAVQTAFKASGKEALMTVYLNKGLWDTSNVEFADGRILAYDKKNLTPRMHYIDYGLGIFRASAFDAVPEGEPTDLGDLYSRLAREGRLAAFETAERFYEVGSPGGLEELRVLIRSIRDQCRKGD
jgi:N-acetyl-alpha-D-muramate 1-phosphate uridylyltransferase